MNISFEPTPNPATFKFVFTEPIASMSAEFLSIDDADTSPLAEKLFGFPWVSSVFVGSDFVTVTKQDWVQWEVLAKPLSELMMDHVNSGLPVMVAPQELSSDISENDSDIVKNIKKVLDREIRPVVALDGGDIVFYKYEDSVLYLKMQGACSGCPSSMATLKDGVEVRMKESFPEIREVVAI